MTKPPRRETAASGATVLSDPVEVARLEVRNGFAQAYEGEQLALTDIERGAFKLRPSHILSLHRKALDGLNSYAGVFRPGAVNIGQSGHSPPAAHLVPELVEEMCDFVNGHWHETPLFLAAYTMWRLKLDSSLYRRKWQNIPDRLICRPFHSARLCPFWRSFDTRANRS